MAFIVNIEGIDVRCDDCDELDALLAIAKNRNPKDKTLSELVTKVAEHVKTIDELRSARSIERRQVREALGYAKPHEAEWTWEHALEEIKRHKAGVVSGLHQAARDTMQATGTIGQHSWAEALDVIQRVVAERNRFARELADAGITVDIEAGAPGHKHAVVGVKPATGKLAEQIVYKAIVPALDARHNALRNGWEHANQADKSELVTLMIEKAEVMLKESSK